MEGTLLSNFTQIFSDLQTGHFDLHSLVCSHTRGTQYLCCCDNWADSCAYFTGWRTLHCSACSWQPCSFYVGSSSGSDSKRRIKATSAGTSLCVLSLLSVAFPVRLCEAITLQGKRKKKNTTSTESIRNAQALLSSFHESLRLSS